MFEKKSTKQVLLVSLGSTLTASSSREGQGAFFQRCTKANGSKLMTLSLVAGCRLAGFCPTISIKGVEDSEMS